jgi:hypothetical protein
LEPSCEPLHPDWTEAGAIIDSEKIAGKMHGSNLANMDENNDQKFPFDYNMICKEEIIEVKDNISISNILESLDGVQKSLINRRKIIE